MIKFLIICIRLYMAGFRISQAPFKYPGYHAKGEKKIMGDCGFYRFYWDYGKTVKVLDMPDIDWWMDENKKFHYNLMYNGKTTNIV